MEMCDRFRSSLFCCFCFPASFHSLFTHRSAIDAQTVARITYVFGLAAILHSVNLLRYTSFVNIISVRFLLIAALYRAPKEYDERWLGGWHTSLIMISLVVCVSVFTFCSFCFNFKTPKMLSLKIRMIVASAIVLLKKVDGRISHRSISCYRNRIGPHPNAFMQRTGHPSLFTNVVGQLGRR